MLARELSTGSQFSLTGVENQSEMPSLRIPNALQEQTMKFMILSATSASMSPVP